jgi:TolA-binding protein
MSLRKYLFMVMSLLILSACAAQRTYIDDVYDSAYGYYSRNQYEQARLYYKKFVNDNPGVALEDVALYYWGDSAREAGKIKEAEEVYNRLIEKYKTGFWVELAKKDLQEMNSFD